MRLTDAAVARLQGEPTEYTVWDTRTPGLGVRIRPSGGRSYVFQGRAGPDAVARRHTLGPAAQRSVAEARCTCLELQTAARQPALPGRRDGDASPRFRDFIETVWGPAFRDRYKPSSRKGVEADLRRQLLPAFGTVRLERITPTCRPPLVRPVQCDRTRRRQPRPAAAPDHPALRGPAGTPAPRSHGDRAAQSPTAMHALSQY